MTNVKIMIMGKFLFFNFKFKIKNKCFIKDNLTSDNYNYNIKLFNLKHKNIILLY